MTTTASCPTITVVVTCHNQAEWIGAAIDSALDQGPNMEVVVIDDGSTDHSGEVLAAYGDTIATTRTENRGVAAARNLGFELARGQLLVFLDGDDCLAPGFVSTCATVLSQSPGAGYAYPTMRLFGAESRVRTAPDWSPRQLCVENFVTPASLFRASAIGATRFDPELDGLEDWDFMLSLLDRGITGAPAPAAELWYRRHQELPSRNVRASGSALRFLRLHISIQRRHRASVSMVSIVVGTAMRVVKWLWSKAVALTRRITDRRGDGADP